MLPAGLQRRPGGQLHAGVLEFMLVEQYGHIEKHEGV
jgi:hypothetical protein